MKTFPCAIRWCSRRGVSLMVSPAPAGRITARAVSRWHCRHYRPAQERRPRSPQSRTPSCGYVVALLDRVRIRAGAWHGLRRRTARSGTDHGEFLPALLGFNAGVEFGQLAVLLRAALALGWARLSWSSRDARFGADCPAGQLLDDRACVFLVTADEPQTGRLGLVDPAVAQWGRQDWTLARSPSRAGHVQAIALV